MKQGEAHDLMEMRVIRMVAVVFARVDALNAIRAVEMQFSVGEDDRGQPLA
jgi:hypothetical protein